MALDLSSNRVFIADQSEFGNVTRQFLGVDGCKVIVSDIGVAFGYAGEPALREVVDVSTRKNALDQTFPLPLDFRIVGIAIMTALGISTTTQETMFTNFITNFTPQQRQAYVQAFEAVDSNHPQAVQDFVNQMLALLS